MITIKDVARRAGVSSSTVSRALSGKIPVDPKTKERVMKAVQELNYHPNALAQGLKEGKTKNIGLIVPNICNPVFPFVSRGVEDVARRMGYTVILCNTDEDIRKEEDYIHKLKNKWVDGIILATAGRQSKHIHKLQESGFPVVLLIRKLSEEMDAVVIDNRRAACEAVTYLISTGHRRIAIMNGSQELTLYRERFEGYLEALQKAGLSFDRTLAVDEPGEGHTYQAVTELLRKGNTPDAIFAVSDPKAMEVMRAVKDAGYQIPRDISVIGFDDLAFSPYLDPPLTTVFQPLYDMGAAAAKRIIHRIEGNPLNEPVVKVMDTKLVIRASTMDRMVHEEGGYRLE